MSSEENKGKILGFKGKVRDEEGQQHDAEYLYNKHRQVGQLGVDGVWSDWRSPSPDLTTYIRSEEAAVRGMSAEEEEEFRQIDASCRVLPESNKIQELSLDSFPPGIPNKNELERELENVEEDEVKAMALLPGREKRGLVTVGASASIPLSGEGRTAGASPVPVIGLFHWTAADNADEALAKLKQAMYAEGATKESIKISAVGGVRAPSSEPDSRSKDMAMELLCLANEHPLVGAKLNVSVPMATNSAGHEILSDRHWVDVFSTEQGLYYKPDGLS